MIQHAIQHLSSQATYATQDLAKIRAEITDQFDNNCIVTAMTMESLIKAQHAHRTWAKIMLVLSRVEGVDAQVEALRTWVADTSERLLDGGRGSSTSLVANASALSGEDVEKEVLRAVRQVVSHADKHSV